MNRFSKYHTILLILVIVVTISLLGLFSYLRGLENSKQKDTSIMISLEVGCGFSCINAKTIEVYRDQSYAIFKGKEEQDTTEANGALDDNDFIKLNSYINNVPEQGSENTDNISGADMILSTLTLFDIAGNTKQYFIYYSSSIMDNSNIKSILELLNKLK